MKDKEVKKNVLPVNTGTILTIGLLASNVLIAKMKLINIGNQKKKIKNMMMMMMRTLCQGTLFRHPF